MTRAREVAVSQAFLHIGVLADAQGISIRPLSPTFIHKLP
jgi:hypothetical protein